MRLYQWESGTPMAEYHPADDDDADALETEPGLGLWALVAPEGAERRGAMRSYLAPLLSQAARWVPAAAQATTRIRAFATAGMRSLSAADQQSIWTEVRGVLAEPATSPFLFAAPTDATTISGNLEGLFGFLAVNFILSQHADGASSAAVGALDLGGASTQISFAPTDHASIMADAYHATLGEEQSTQVYSHSFMNAGQDQARQRLAEELIRRQQPGFGPPGALVPNPCSSPGYLENRTVRSDLYIHQLIGTGDYDACRELMPALLHPEYECLQPPCSVAGVYQPALPTQPRAFVGYSAFFYTVNGILGDVVGCKLSRYRWHLGCIPPKLPAMIVRSCGQGTTRRALTACPT